MLEDLKTLESEGVEIMTCGTCLNYYGLPVLRDVQRYSVLIHSQVPAGDGVGAEHGCVFFQCKQRIVERTAAADRITIRVFVAQNQDVIRSKQLFCHLRGLLR